MFPAWRWWLYVAMSNPSKVDIVPRSIPIPMSQYLLKKTIQRHYDSINALAFSHDGNLFASGADDGLIIIFRGGGSGKELRRFQSNAPITTLFWRSRFGRTVVAGDASGDVHTICLDGTGSVSIARHRTHSIWDVLFAGKPILSYHQRCAWTRSLHCTERCLAGYRLRQGCPTG
jgi:WD40 repeat protein